jgi:ribosomal protein L7/L12
MDELLDDVRKLADCGRTIDAIKRYREITGLGLKEAKDAIDRYASGGPLEAAESPAARSAALDPSMPADAEIKRMLEAGRKFEAVKLLRARSGLDLATAKDIADRMEADLNRAARSRPGSAASLDRTGGGFLRWILAGLVIAAGIAAYVLLRQGS